jgi:tetratricopeptide (TPR) repeat protein
LAGGLIVAAGLGAYANSFWGPFVYDDLSCIVDNSSIRQLWPLSGPLSPPCIGGSVTSRPLLNLSLAVNYRLGGLNVWGYHATNLAIHLIGGLLLLGIVRRTFLLPVLRPRYGDAAWGLALAIAVLWTLHPLQTESVTYIIQRAESLAGLLYLLVLYSVIRSLRSSHRAWWHVVAVGACFLGAAVKEPIVSAPVVVLLYDYTFLEDSFRKILQRRWGLYAGLFASWGLVAYLQAKTGLPVLEEQLGSIGFWAYVRSQPGVILYYLRLSLWPHPLCFSYEWPVARTLGEILPGTLVVGLLGMATVWGLWKRRGWGFLGAWFFLILAPTSSVMPLKQLAFEHRMYLSLASVVALVASSICLGGQRLVSWGVLSRRACMAAGVSLAVVAGGMMGVLTFQRNEVYQSPLSIWKNTVAMAPRNPYARSNLGNALATLGRHSEALEQYEEAVRLKPDDYAEGHNNWGNALLKLGRPAEAIEHYREAVGLKPDDAVSHYNWGNALSTLDRPLEAVEHYEKAIRLKPDHAEAHNNLGNALSTVGRHSESIEHYQQAIRLKPDYAEAHNNWGNTLLALGRFPEAIEHYQEAIRLSPGDSKAYYNWGNALVTLGQYSEGIEQYRQAIRLNPNDAVSHYNWGNVLLTLGQQSEAIEQYRRAVRIQPDYADAHNNWGNALSALGRYSEAIEHYLKALQIKPEAAAIQLNVSLVLQQVGRTREAAEHGREAVRLMPDHSQAHQTLAWFLATHEEAVGGDPTEAVKLAERACALTGRRNIGCLDTLAAAYASAGRFEEAIATAKEAWRLADAAGEGTLAQEIHIRLQLYRDRKPYREPRGGTTKDHP